MAEDVKRCACSEWATCPEHQAIVAGVFAPAPAPSERCAHGDCERTEGHPIHDEEYERGGHDFIPAAPAPAPKCACPPVTAAWPWGLVCPVHGPKPPAPAPSGVLTEQEWETAPEIIAALRAEVERLTKGLADADEAVKIQRDEIERHVDGRNLTEAWKAAETAEAQRDALLKALRDVMGLIESEHLVRNINNDGSAGWALRMLTMVKTLADAAAAIKEASHE